MTLEKAGAGLTFDISTKTPRLLFSTHTDERVIGTKFPPWVDATAFYCRSNGKTEADFSF